MVNDKPSQSNMRNYKETILTLTEGERRILKYLADKNLHETYQDTLITELEVNPAEIFRSVLWLENKNILKRIEEKKKLIILSEKGKKYIDSPLPEQKLLDYLKSRKSLSFDEIYQIPDISKEEASAAIGKLARLGLIRILKSEGKIELTEKGIKIDVLPSMVALNSIIKEKGIDFSKVKTDREIQDLLRRGLVKVMEVIRWKIKLTDFGKWLLSRGIPEVEVIDKITPDVIAKKEWVNKQLRWYDVTSPVPKIWGGRKHPLRLVIEKIRRVFLEMGFREMRGPWVEIAFWNMDGMWIPQDHPAREMQATFYLSNPRYGYVKDRELVLLVKKVQEGGADTGSLGWQQPWDETEAMKTLLRTHTTAVTFRVLGFIVRNDLVKLPVKFFAIGRTFRNETIDWKHLAEFHQVEGFVIAENLTLRSLMGYLREFYWKMGIKKLRFKPTYNPYTEPSMEIFAWHSDAGKWVEVGNSGLFRPETLRPYGIKYPVIAWGLAVERLAMLLYGIEDIREVFGPMCDIDWLRWYKIPLKEVFE